MHPRTPSVTLLLGVGPCATPGDTCQSERHAGTHQEGHRATALRPCQLVGRLGDRRGDRAHRVNTIDHGDRPGWRWKDGAGPGLSGSGGAPAPVPRESRHHDTGVARHRSRGSSPRRVLPPLRRPPARHRACGGTSKSDSTWSRKLSRGRVEPFNGRKHGLWPSFRLEHIAEIVEVLRQRVGFIAS